MSRQNKGDKDMGSAVASDSSGSGLTARVFEPDPDVARALRKIARRFPAGFSVSVRKSAPMNKIEIACSEDQWKKLQEDELPPMMRLIVELQDDGQLKLRHRSPFTSRSKGNGHAQPERKVNGHEKPSTT